MSLWIIGFEAGRRGYDYVNLPPEALQGWDEGILFELGE